MVQIGFGINWRSEVERERAIRRFFADRDLSIAHDYLAGNGDVPDATRCLDYFVPADVQSLTRLTKDILHKIYHLEFAAGLDFTLEEQRSR